MRLEIHCQDRLGIAQEILNILVSYQLDLRGIEVDGATGRMFVSFPSIHFEQFQELMAKIRRITGVSDVKTTAFMPSERHQNELTTLLKTLPDGIIGIDTKAVVSVINDAALEALEVERKAIEGEPLPGLVKGFNFMRWLESDDVLAQTRRVEIQGKPFIADLLPVMVPDENGHEVLAGAVINLKSESRLGQHMLAFNKGNQESFQTLQAHSPQMRKVIREAKKMALLDGPLLITGETGTGKELLARACHAAGSRAGKPFLAVNCASMPDNVAESELFGYGPNAFVGSTQGKKGIFEQANGGSVFLDEVGEMSRELQTKLLRFLQDGSFRRVADENEVRVDVRVICTTQKDLPAMVQEGKFREDLYYRLNVFTLALPALRERKQDIVPLSEHFVARFAARLGRKAPRFSESCVQFLQSYPWPGNVRQLENALYRAVTLLEGYQLDKEHLQLPSFTSDFGYLEQEFDGTLDEAVKRFEASLLRKLYPAYPSSRQLAKKLGLSHTAVANKLRDYGINRKTVKI
ncbi:transcriptional regulator TyrR [Alkalimonas delamerensis]|uniref:HTH-type transcriptional regulatory protein TyrR n=1 Tax=Alkalimonas delamerensis TaxID=265981 RepID=A0ABT9GSN4_9GAMM|nr:transcriptional regulator TyrR [Alkalimonas delamerensis]MDP4529962.1 transcriptional regulator TyrR [Alkalimonas delamerensis]